MLWFLVSFVLADDPLAYQRKLFPYLVQDSKNHFEQVGKVIENKLESIVDLYREEYEHLHTRDSDFDDSINWDDYRQARCGLTADLLGLVSCLLRYYTQIITL